MFENYKKYSKIIVLGAQRSGTTIVSKIIAKELNYICIDETYFEVDNFERFLSLFSLPENMVIQAPGLVHKITDMPESALKLFVIRPINEIIASQERINWTEKYEQYEKNKFIEKYPYLKNDDFFNYCPISIVKRMFFNLYISEGLKNYSTIDYHSLSEHEMFINKELRKDFTPKQTNL